MYEATGGEACPRYCALNEGGRPIFFVRSEFSSGCWLAWGGIEENSNRRNNSKDFFSSHFPADARSFLLVIMHLIFTFSIPYNSNLSFTMVPYSSYLTLPTIPGGSGSDNDQRVVAITTPRYVILAD